MLFRPEFVAKRGKPTEADVKDDAERPHVNGASIFAMLAVFEDFRRNVGRSSA